MLKCRSTAFFGYFEVSKCCITTLLISLTNWLSNTYEILYILYRYTYIT
nr:MAG TPA: hypothetical protein [Crassvirales sp.]